MEDRQINLLLSRILSGYYYIFVRDQRFRIQYPSIQIKYEAELIAQNTFHKIKFEGWYTKETIIKELIRQGIWSNEQEQQLNSMNALLDDYKVALYQNHFNPKTASQIRKKIDSTRRSYRKLFARRHAYDEFTIEGYCETIANTYLFEHSVFDDENKKILINDNDSKLFQEIYRSTEKEMINVATFKKIARSDAWRSFWSAKENNIFNGSVVDWTDEQKTLVVLTKMYEGAKESMEAPPDNVFEDDDMFEGWMILQRRETEKNRNKNRAEKSLGDKHKNAGEVFIMADSKEESNQIYDLNDAVHRNIIAERQKVIKSQDKFIQETDLPDVRRDIIIQSNNLRKK